MKIKTIEQICKASKTIILYNTNTIQWISNGAAIYPLYNLPTLSEDNVFTMFDIHESKRDKFLFEENDGLPRQYDFEDAGNGEEMLTSGSLMIQKAGALLMPLKTQLGLTFINTRYLAPFNDMDEGVQLYQRIDATGKVYIAVKSGLSLFGIIMPVDNIVDNDFIDELDSLSMMSKVAVENKGTVKHNNNYIEDCEEQSDEEGDIEDV